MTGGLFDIHVHLGASDTGEVYYPPLEGPAYLRLMDAAGVSQACAFPPLRTAGYAASNRRLLAWCGTTGGRVRPLARVGGDRVPVTEPEVWLARKALRARLMGAAGRGRAAAFDLDPGTLRQFAGVKLLPHLDGVPGRVFFDEVRALRLPVLTHAGRYVPARWVARAVLPHLGPDQRLILAHLGAFPDAERELRQAVALAESDRRVVLDTSGIWIEDFLRYAVARVPEQVIFGSDAPLTTPAVAWAMVEAAVPDAGLRDRIGRGLALEVFGDPAEGHGSL